jgi:hypothetical protein
MVACGARTGLWIDVEADSGSAGDASARVDAPPDTSLDAQVDTQLDAPLDATDKDEAELDAAPDVELDAPLDAAAEASDACDDACGCPAGTMAVGSSCMPVVGAIPAPRPLSPLSTARVTSALPILTWELPPLGDGSVDDGAVIQCCADRACTRITQSFVVQGTSGSPGVALPAGVTFWRLFGTSGGSVGATAGPTWELFVPVGASSTPVKTWWGSTLDFDGDGLADVGVGAPWLNGYTGAAYLYASRRGGGPVTTPLEMAGTMTNTDFGCTVDSAGDINGDGFGDVVVGQCDWASPQAVYVYLGGPSGVSTTPTTLPGQGSGQTGYGWTAGTAGDTNGDGYGDLLVGSQSGIGYLYLGGPSGIAATPPTPLQNPVYGGVTAVANVDVNGDGWGDVVVGGDWAYDLDGAVSVYLGSPSGLSTTPMGLYGPGWMSYARFGSTLGIGDVNADGYADLLVGAYGYADGVGQAFLFMGGPGGLSTAPIGVPAPDSTAGEFTVGLSGAHDVNGDGFDDFVIGASFDGHVGATWLYLGGASGLAMPIEIAKPAGASEFGNAAAGGDADGDGYADVLVADEGASSGAGAAYLYRGGPGGLSTTPTALLNPHAASGVVGAFGFSLGM